MGHFCMSTTKSEGTERSGVPWVQPKKNRNAGLHRGSLRTFVGLELVNRICFVYHDEDMETMLLP